jgi:predicted phage-related endonuclease
MGLSAEELADRKHYANASVAGIIMGSDKEKLMNLYLEYIGEKEPDDLSMVIPVQVGACTENFNLLLAEDKIGKSVVDRQRVVKSDKYPWLRATLDGVVEPLFPVEAKHVRAFYPVDNILPRFNPQVQQQMLLLGAPMAYLSIIIGTFEHVLLEIEADPIFQSQLIHATKNFMDCVKSRTPPVTLGIKTPVVPVRKIDMSSSNSWAQQANIWLSNKEYAKAFETATKEIKSLVEDDAIEAYGAGIVAKRSKTGSITIREAK